MPPIESAGRSQLTGRMTLTEQLLDALGREIVLGRFAESGFPTEAEISEAYSTSRSVTREAIKMLTSKGMLSARPRSGIVVQPERSWSLLDADVLRWMLERKFSYKLLQSFTEMRLGIEPTAAALAARRADVKAIDGIERGLQRMIAAERGEDDHLTSDVAFHVAILDATGNPFYVQLHELVNTALRISIQLTNRIKGHTASIPAHRRVFDAIKAGDAAAAHAAMSSIINDVLVLIADAQAREADQGKPRKRVDKASVRSK
ncbi:FadR/GntR family transcriptional regulator [Lysobacter sp. CA199]|uniref:FadR/GntR family transcriptional regulator n=1 Tax=Lysobacter sp. CA199 TaxID=3455608 RepID=UPI003F8D413F